jgi:hypothetical protein
MNLFAPFLLREQDGVPAGNPGSAGPGTVAEPPEQLDDETPEEEQEEKPQMVPLNALIEERRKWKAREQELMKKIPDHEAKPTSDTKGPLTPEEEAAWERHLQSLPIGKKLVKALEELETIKAETGRFAVAAAMATELFHDRLVRDADGHYDKTMPVSRDVWHEVVAAKMTDELLGRVYNGDGGAWKEIIASAKKALGFKGSAPVKSQVDLQREREARSVKRLPAQPGTGGAPPAPPEPERLTGTKLHQRAFAMLQDSFTRAKE